MSDVGTPNNPPPAPTSTEGSSTTTPAPATPPTPEAKPAAPEPAPRRSLLNQEPEAKPETKPEPKKEGEPKKDEPKAGPPEKYEFKAPEGFEWDEKALEGATELFKKNGMSQEAAQEFVDLYGKKLLEAGQQPYKAWADTQEEWVKEIKTKHGTNLDAVRASIGRAIGLLGPDLEAKFRDGMNFTGAGNHPAFVDAMYAWSKLLGEGTAVGGNGPGEQIKPDGGKPTLAQAIYPNLPSTARGS